MEQGLTWQRTVSGVAHLKEHILMSGFLTPMPPRTDTPSHLPATESTSGLRSVRMNKGSEKLTPLVLSATGGLANEANIFYKRLASMLASKWDHPYSSTLCWLRCRLAFSLLRSAIQSIRGARSSCGHAIKILTVVDLVNMESKIFTTF